MPQPQTLLNQQKLWKTFLIFLLPLIATNILQNLSGTINTVFVGQMMGVNAIAAVAIFFPILFCLMALSLDSLRVQRFWWGKHGGRRMSKKYAVWSVQLYL